MAIHDTFKRTIADGDQLDDGYFNGLAALAPIGAVVSWLKSYTNTPALPDGWVECNGQTLSDADSVYDGQVIPDLNGDNRFLRASSTSGSTGGAESINLQHAHSGTTSASGSSGGGNNTHGSGVLQHTHTYSTSNALSTTQSILPKYYSVVMIIRIK